MKKLTLITTLVIFALATPVLAKTQLYHHTGSTPPAHTAKHHTVISFIHGTVSATTTTSITIASKKSSVTVTITDATLIEHNGDTLALSDIKTGTKVSVQVKDGTAEVVEVGRSEKK